MKRTKRYKSTGREELERNDTDMYAEGDKEKGGKMEGGSRKVR